MRGALAVARLAARESSPTYAALGALAGAAAVAAAFGGAGDIAEAARARLAAGYAAGAAEVVALAAAALAVALTLPRDRASGHAATVLVRPIGRGAFVLARFGGALGAALAGVLAAIATLALGLALASGPSAIASLAPRDAIPPRAAEVPDASGAPVPAPERFGLASGDEALFRFDGLAGRRVERLRIAASYSIVPGDEASVPTPAAFRIRARGTAPGGRAIEPADLGRIEIAVRGTADAPLPPAFAGAESIVVLLTLETRGAAVGFDLRPARADAPAGRLRAPALVTAPRSLALATAKALLALLVEAAFVAALATLGATLLSAWPAAIFALGLGVAARAPELLRAAQQGGFALASTGHDHGGGGGGAPAGPPGLLARTLGAAAEGLATALPDLSRLDLGSTLVGGAEPSLLAPDVAAAALRALLWIAAALALAWLAFRRAEPAARGGAA